MPHICVCFVSDGRDWGQYLVSLLQSKRLELQVVTFDVNQFLEGQKQDDGCNTALLKLLLISPEFLQYLKKPLPKWLPDPQNTSLNVLSVLCAVEATDLPKDIRALDWSVLSLDDSDEGIRKLIKDIVKTVDQCEENQKAPAKPPTPKPRPRQSKGESAPAKPPTEATSLAIPMRSKFRITRVLPPKVTFPGEELVIIFSEPIEGGDSIEVDIQGTRISPKILNPYTYLIKAPEGFQGKVQMLIYRGQEKLNSYPLTFQPMDLAAFTYSNMLSQALQLPPDDKESLDQKLVEILESSLPGGQFEGLFSSSLATTKGSSEKSDKRLPTVLHFAAFNGLRELTCRLLETPGSLLAYRLENCDGLDPAELADCAGFTELAEYLRNYAETKITVDMVDDMYVTMNGHSLLYVNTKPCAGEEIDDYMYAPVSYPPPPTKTEHPDDDCDENVYLKGHPTKLVPDRLPPKHPSRANSERNRPREFSHEVAAKSATIPRGFCFGEDPPTPGTVGSRSLQELKQIQIHVAQGQFSSETAQQLFEAWKMRYSKPTASFCQRQKALQELRETFRATLETAEESKEKSEMGRFLTRVRSSRKKWPSKQVGYGACGNNMISSPIYEASSEEENANHPIYSDVDLDRASSYSSASGGSRGSRTSTESSGFDSSLDDINEGYSTYSKTNLCRNSAQRSRLSRRERVLQDPSALKMSQAPRPPRRPKKRQPMPTPPRH